MYAAAVVAVILVILVLAMRSGADLVVTVKAENVTVKGTLPPAHQARIKQFFEDDLVSIGPCKILGTLTDPGRLKLRFHGPITPAQQQRIRNFLLSTLDR